MRQMLPHEALQPLIDELTQQVDQAIGEATRQGLLDTKDTFADAPFASRLALASAACTDRNWLWENYFSRGKPISAGMFTLRTTPVLLDATEALIGPEILAHPQFALRPKMPDLDLMDIPWHQDLAYLIPAEAGETLVVNFWIPLVKATEQNGCMQVIPGSHREGLIAHDLWLETPGHKGARGIADADLPASSIVTCEVDAGDVLMTTERLVHRSIPNRSADGALERRYTVQPYRPADGPLQGARLCRPQPATSRKGRALAQRLDWKSGGGGTGPLVAATAEQTINEAKR